MEQRSRADRKSSDDRSRSPLAAVVVTIVAFALLMPMLPASAAPINPAPDATWQTNGRVRTVQYSPDGSVVYIAGEFTSVRPPGSPLGSNEVARNHAAAFYTTTGGLLAWNPNLGGNVWSLAVSPDGKTVYMGGDFLTVRSLPRMRLVAVDATTGAPTSWNPSADGQVRVILPSPSGARVYVGGEFSRIDGTLRHLVAAIHTADRNLAGTFKASVTQYTNDTCPPRCPPVVASLALSSDGKTLYIGGHFGLIDGHGPINNAGSVDAQTGTVVGAWNPNIFHRNLLTKNQKNTVYAILPYQNHVYICGDFYWVGGVVAPNLASTLATNGSLDSNFKAQDDGGTPACSIGGSLLYIGGHFLEVDGVSRTHIAAVDLVTGALDPWSPVANSGRGVHAFATLGSGQSFTLGVGGDFTKIGNAYQQGFARFTVPQPGTDQLHLSKSGIGGGSITSSPLGISCGATCSAAFNTGTLVTLTATPDATSTFSGWSGAGCSGTGTCQVTMNQAESVTARFGTVYRPDGLLAHGVRRYAGNNIYNTTGAGQTRRVTSRRGSIATFRWKVQNDGPVVDRIVFAAHGHAFGFKVRFYLGGANVTRAVLAGRYAKNLASGRSLTITVKVWVLTRAKVGSVRSEWLKVTSRHKPVSDVVLAKVEASR
jgi:Divergent InlB B-repeat domain